MANYTNETRTRAIEMLDEYRKYQDAGLSERQIADLFGISSISTFRFFKVLLRYYAKHECSVSFEGEEA